MRADGAAWRDLTTERLLVRRFRQEDLEPLSAILADPEVMRCIEPPMGPEDAARFLREAGLGEDPLVYAAVLRETGALIGHVIFHPWVESGVWELGWILAQVHWGRGFACELTAALIARAREAGIPALVIECDPDQAASAHIARKYGFIEEDPRDGLRVFRRRFGRDEPFAIPAGPERAGEMRSLLAAAFRPLLEKYHDAEQNPACKSEERVRSDLARGDADGWLLCQDGETVGCARVVRRAPGEYSLADLAVRPDRQGRGLAQRFLRELEGCYPQARRWSLVTILEEERDCRLYEKLGYRAERVIAQVRPGMHFVLYGKEGPAARREE